MTPWDQGLVKAREKDTEDYGKTLSPTKDTVVNETRRMSMREQARALLEGKQKWKPATSKSLGQMVSR